MAKIFWIGDGGCHTGFARVTHSIGERLVSQYGHEVHVLAANYRGDPWTTNLNLYVPTIEDRNDILGQRRIVELLAEIEPDAVVILNDPNIILDLLGRNKFDQSMVLLRYRPLLTYIPIDGLNYPPEWALALKKFTKVVAMSEHGQRELGGVDLVYHGIDTDRFHPVSTKHPLVLSNGKKVTSKTEAKRAFGWDPDDFIVLRVDKNSGRKDFPASWKALVPFMRRHTNVKVHFQTEEKRHGETGYDMHALMSREQDVHGRFVFPDPKAFNSYRGWPEEDLIGLYNAADVFISTSRGEGFGLTIAEALACGLPVIAQNVSAVPEVVGPGGILIEPSGLITTPAGKDNWLPDVDGFTAALERIYQSKGLRRSLSEAGREHITKLANWDEAARLMDGHLRQIIADGEKASQLISEGEASNG